MVADALQKDGIKKTAVQKAMDTLAANGKISFKDYGKQRVCVANQSQFEIPDINELDVMKKKNDQLLADVAAVRSHVSDLEAGVYALALPKAIRVHFLLRNACFTLIFLHTIL